MTLRLRLFVTIAAVALPMVVGLVWFDARSRHRAAEEVLARIGQSVVDEPDARARCEASPATWGAARPPGGHGPPGDHRAGDGPPLGPPPHDRGPRLHGPPPGPRAAPPVMYAYDRALRSAKPGAPTVTTAQARALETRAWIALPSRAFSDEVMVLVRTSWADGSCAFVVVRGTTTRGFLGAILPASEVWLVPLLALVIAVVIAVGPFVQRIRRLTRDVRHAAATGFTTAPTPTGSDEVRELGEAFAAASVEVQRQLAARDDRERALREFLANTTHDVMIPLTVLTQHLASLRARSPAGADVDVDRLLTGAMDEAHYLAALIHNLSVAAKVDVVEPVVERTAIDLNAVIARIAARHRPIAAERGLELATGVPETPVFADADLTMIEQAISNVVYNAIRYNRRGGHVAITLDREDGQFVLRVLDDGPGIPPPDLGSLIRRGFRSDAARTRSTGGHGGHGIGLHITHTVARLHGYQLEFKNREPSGLEVELRGALAPGGGVAIDRV